MEEEEIEERIRSAVMLRPPFRLVVGDKPDLYGPFWLASTLVVIIVASSSLITFLHDEKLPYNFDQIPVASSLVLISLLRYTEFALAVPILSHSWSRFLEGLFLLSRY